MTKPNADVELLVTQQRAIQSIEAFERRFLQMTNRLDQAMRRTSQTAQQQRTAFGGIRAEMEGLIASTGRWLAGLASVMTAAQAIRLEYQNIADNQIKSREQTLTFSQAMENLRASISMKRDRVNDMSAPQIEAAIIGAQAVDPTSLVNAVQASISADSTLPVSQRVKTVVDLARLRPDLQEQPTALKYMATALTGQIRVFGGDAESQLGMVEMAKQVARIVDTEQFAKYIGPAAEKLGELGFTQQDALGLLAAYSTAAGDPTGETTQTNVTKVMTQLTGVIREKLHRPDVKGMDMVKLVQSKTPEGEMLRNHLIGVMQDDATPEELRQLAEFKIGKLVGRSSGKTAMYALFQEEGVGEDRYMKLMLKESLNVIPHDLEVARAEQRRRQSERNASPMFQAFEFDRINRAAAANARLSINESGRETVVKALSEIESYSQGSGVAGFIKSTGARIMSRHIDPKEGVDLILADIGRRRRLLEWEREGSPERRLLSKEFWLGYPAYTDERSATDYPATNVVRQPVSPAREAELDKLIGVLERQARDTYELRKTMNEKEKQPRLAQPKEPAAAELRK